MNSLLSLLNTARTAAIIGGAWLVGAGETFASPPLNGTGAPQDRVVLVSSTLADGAQQYLDQLDHRVDNAFIMTVAAIDPDHDLKPNYDVIEDLLDRKLAPGYNGVIVLDWEAEFFAALKGGPSHPDFNKAINKGKAVIAFVKGKRPNAKVGYYGIATDRWQTDPALLQPLFDAMDVIMPGAYMADRWTYERNLEKLHANVRRGLEAANGKPVLVFHSPRWASKGGDIGMNHVERDMWISYLQQTFTLEVDGRRAAGVVLWDNSMRLMEQGVLDSVDHQYIPAGMPIEAYLTHFQRHYLCAAAQAVIPGMVCSQSMPSMTDGAVAGDANATPTWADPGDADDELPPAGVVIDTDSADEDSLGEVNGTGGIVMVQAPRKERAGIDLAPLDPLVSGHSFTNMLWTSSPWQVFDADDNMIEGAEFNEHGYPMPGAQQKAMTVIGANAKGSLPPGKWLCVYEGAGTLTFSGDAQLVKEQPGRIVVRVTPSAAGVTLTVSDVSAGDPLRNVRVMPFSVMQGNSSSLLHPQLVNRLRGDQPGVLRFAAWQQIENSPLVHWADRPTLASSSQLTERGAAIELMTELCNVLSCDAWLHVPARANDEYVQQFARLVRNKLDAGRKVFIEYASDALNPANETFAFLAEQGRSLEAAGSDAEAASKFYGKRSKEVFDIFRAEFSSQPGRVVCVFGVPGDDAEAAALLLDSSSAVQSADVIGVSGGVGGPRVVDELELLATGLTIDRIVSLLTDSRSQRMPVFKSVAERVHATGKPMIVATSGAGMMVDAGGLEKRLVSLMRKAENDPRVRGMTSKERELWIKAGALWVMAGDSPAGAP